MDPISILKSGERMLWLNPSRKCAAEALDKLPFSIKDIEEAEDRLRRFAPLIEKLFPETRSAGGIIESPLTEIPNMREALNVKGRLFVKRDSDLAIAGSVKARGGIYEVLKHTEDILGEAVFSMTPDEIRERLKGYTVQVGSTGNLGLSIGIMSAALGYRAIVHMSSDAKEWKKALLREKGVTVVEYEGDYSSAVKRGREASNADPASYFVDDENSLPLFMGYAAAALRLKKQLDEAGVKIDKKHPLNLWLPCGVGGAPGGIAFGVKTVFADSANCYFVEPTQAPCMLAALLTGKPVPVTRLGLSGKTEADGLAVGTASKLVYDAVKELVSGEITVDDGELGMYQNLLYKNEKLFIEPSSAASFGFARYLGRELPNDKNAVHIAWATGGSLVPESERKKQLRTEVAAALIWRNGRFMAARRPMHKARGGLWEFVGGKIEEGESGREALKRECREELGVTVTVRDEVMSTLHHYPDITVEVHFYDAEIAEGEPKLLEHSAIEWISPTDIEKYEFCPADESMLAKLYGRGPIRRLFEKSDAGYARFQRKLIPDVDPNKVIGVRLPAIRSIAKEIYGSGEAEEFLFGMPHYYYDENMLHAMLLNEIKDTGRLFYELDEFLPHVNNWAVCDTLKPKAFTKHRDRLWEKIPEYLSSKHPFAVRFGLGMLMSHFLDEDFTPAALDLADGVMSGEYYVRMMKAWFFATALAKQYEAALPYYERGFADAEVKRMTKRKCLDSFRISDEKKNYIKTH